MNSVWTNGNSLFEELVKKSGLASVFASAALARAFSRVGIDHRTLSRPDVLRALPSIERALAVYLPPDQVRVRMHAIEQLARER